MPTTNLLSRISAIFPPEAQSIPDRIIQILKTHCRNSITAGLSTAISSYRKVTPLSCVHRQKSSGNNTVDGCGHAADDIRAVHALMCFAAVIITIITDMGSGCQDSGASDFLTGICRNTETSRTRIHNGPIGRYGI